MKKGLGFGSLMLVLFLALVMVTSVFAALIFRHETSQNLLTAPLNYTATYSTKARILGVFLHSAAAVTDNVTITLDSKTNATYDTVLDTEFLNATTDYVWLPANDIILENGDGLKVYCSNDTNTSIYATIEAESY